MNPYAPPQATVADVVQPDTRGPRPAAVSWAVGLFWADLILGLVDPLLPWPPPGDLAYFVAVAVYAVVTGIGAWVVLKISVGRNWARWVALVSAIIATLMGLQTLGQTLARSPLAVVLEGVSFLLDVAALLLLFVSSGRRWFAPLAA